MRPLVVIAACRSWWAHVDDTLRHGAHVRRLGASPKPVCHRRDDRPDPRFVRFSRACDLTKSDLTTSEADQLLCRNDTPDVEPVVIGFRLSCDRNMTDQFSPGHLAEGEEDRPGGAGDGGVSMPGNRPKRIWRSRPAAPVGKSSGSRNRLERPRPGAARECYMSMGPWKGSEAAVGWVEKSHVVQALQGAYRFRHRGRGTESDTLS